MMLTRSLAKLPGLDWPCWRYPTVASSNSEAMRLIDENQFDRALIWADQQTAGRGQHGKSFFSPPDKGLYLSFIWNDSYELPDMQAATLRAGLLLAQTVDSWLSKADYENSALAGKYCSRIKWINDLILRERKVAGILWEHYKSHNILGIGINLFLAELPEDIASTAGSVFPAQTDLDQDKMVAGLWRKLDHGLFFSDWSLDETELRSRLLPNGLPDPLPPIR